MRQAVEAYKAGKLSTTDAANVQAHAGMGIGRGMRRGVGRGAGMGRGAGGAFPQTSAPSPTATTSPAPSREEEIASLKGIAGTLRKQLAEVMERLDRLEKEE